jgi:crotonobetainyl-CoA:carnitine CoA-transferase CaiB-like acyl-CoA transferase
MSEQKTLLSNRHRVLDLCEGRAHICGKILGDLGCDVTQIERPGGDPARNIGPFYDDIPDPNKSLWWWAYNMNKKGITLNIKSSDGREIFRKMVTQADFVIESFEPGYLDDLGLGYEELEKINPRIILVSCTAFGTTGPYAHYKAPDIVLMSLGGQTFMAGDDDRPPVQISYPHAWQFAGLHGAMGAMNAHYYRELTGEGQHVASSAQSGVVWTNMNANVTWDLSGINTTRGGAIRRMELPQADGTSEMVSLRSTFECKDGYVYCGMIGGEAGASRMRILSQWMEDWGFGVDWMKDFDWHNDFDFSSISQEKIDRLEEAVGPFLMAHTKMELYEEALKRNHWLVPIGSPKSVWEDPQLRYREFWEEVEHPELGRNITYPGWPIIQSETPWKPQGRAPLIGEHNEETYIGELGFSKEELSILKASGVI